MFLYIAITFINSLLKLNRDRKPKATYIAYVDDAIKENDVSYIEIKKEPEIAIKNRENKPAPYKPPTLRPFALDTNLDYNNQIFYILIKFIQLFDKE